MANRSLIGRFADACIGSSQSIDSWAAGLCDAAEPLFQRAGGQGSVIVFNSSRANAAIGVNTSTVASNAGKEAFAAMFDVGLDQVFSRVGPDFRAAFRPFRISFLSQLFKRSGMRGFEPWEQFFRKETFIDQIGIDVPVDGFSILTTVIRARGWAKERNRDLRTMRRLMARTFPARLRSLSEASADMIMTPDGRLLHASGGLSRNTATILSKAVRAMECARLDVRAEEEGERLWEELLAGRWSVVEHIDSDGKRLMLLGRSSRSRDARLTDDERALLRRVDQSDSIKRIAIDLDKSLATISERISGALAKLGFQSRSEYRRFCSLL